MVRAFTHGVMGRRINPSWIGPIELFLIPASAPCLVCNKGRGMCYPVCGMVHTKQPLLQLERVAYAAAAGFLSRYLSGPLPYVGRHITANKMC